MARRCFGLVRLVPPPKGTESTTTPEHPLATRTRRASIRSPCCKHDPGVVIPRCKPPHHRFARTTGREGKRCPRHHPSAGPQLHLATIAPSDNVVPSCTARETKVTPGRDVHEGRPPLREHPKHQASWGPAARFALPNAKLSHGVPAPAHEVPTVLGGRKSDRVRPVAARQHDDPMAVKGPLPPRHAHDTEQLQPKRTPARRPHAARCPAARRCPTRGPAAQRLAARRLAARMPSARVRRAPRCCRLVRCRRDAIARASLGATRGSWRLAVEHQHLGCVGTAAPPSI